MRSPWRAFTGRRGMCLLAGSVGETRCVHHGRLGLGERDVPAGAGEGSRVHQDRWAVVSGNPERPRSGLRPQATEDPLPASVNKT